MKVKILNAMASILDYAETVESVFDFARRHESRYICVANVHTLMEAYDSKVFRGVVNEADLTVPDGMPLVWMLRLKGYHRQGRVYGPTLMLKVLERAARECVPVGLFGGDPAVLDALVRRMQARYAGLNIAFSLSPPFRELSFGEDVEIVKQINHSGARIILVGLGCPKQELWMAAHRGKVKAVMIGVGAAFDFHAGSKPQAYEWMQRLGLEWLFRLIMEPRRLWKRYLIHNPRFVILAVADLLGLPKD